jgi:hypothetical protein
LYAAPAGPVLPAASSRCSSASVPWVKIVFKGTLGDNLWRFTRDVMTYALRVEAYALLIHDEFPRRSPCRPRRRRRRSRRWRCSHDRGTPLFAQRHARGATTTGWIDGFQSILTRACGGDWQQLESEWIAFQRELLGHLEARRSTSSRPSRGIGPSRRRRCSPTTR